MKCSHPRKSLVLVKIDHTQENIQYQKQPEMTIADSVKEDEALVYSKVISFSDLLDPTLYYQQRFGRKNALKLTITNEKTDQKMIVDFSKSK